MAIAASPSTYEEILRKVLGWTWGEWAFEEGGSAPLRFYTHELTVVVRNDGATVIDLKTLRAFRVQEWPWGPEYRTHILDPVTQDYDSERWLRCRSNDRKHAYKLMQKAASSSRKKFPPWALVHWRRALDHFRTA